MNREWFIEQSYFGRFHAAVSGNVPVASNPEKVEKIRGNADRWARKGYASDNLQVRNGEAHISIGGVLLDSASVIDELYAKYLGENYSTYAGIVAQINAAESNPEVEKIVFNVDSPGGIMAGVDEAAMAIATSPKATEARVGWLAASAAYYLSSQADSIVATSPSASFGSIGVVVELADLTEYYAKCGVKTYSLTSTEAPDKRKEPHSEEFKQQIVARLDALHGVFANRVAEGRSRATGKDFTTDQVNADFGRGGLLIAEAAVSVGMVDRISEDIAKSTSTNKEAEMAEEKTTGAAFAEQLTAAREEGMNIERARVAALLPWMGVDSERVVSAIESGESLTPEMTADLSKVAAEKAAAQVTPASAAQVREEDEAPQVSGVDTGADDAEESAADTDALFAAASKQSKVRVKGGK